MSEEKKKEIMDEIRDSLSKIPDRYQADVGRSIAHDISVMERTIRIAETDGAAK